VQAVKKADPDAWIWDTCADGRPDMLAVTYKLVVESQAEAAFIISNPKLTRKVMYGMQSRMGRFSILELGLTWTFYLDI
jgi:hypothetical protein